MGEIEERREDLYRLPGGAVVGEKPGGERGLPEELRDTALSREEVEQFLFEVKQQPTNWRREADKCCDYYDGNQLSPESLETLKDRGQPELISNHVKPTIDTVLGMEAKTRTDWRVRPEDDETCTDEMAEALSLKLKHAETESRADRAISDAYAAQCKAGLGWIEVSSDSDPFNPPYRVRYVHRREISWDWKSVEPDLSDARYLVRRRWLDLDHAIAMMPRYASLFRMSMGGWAGFDPVIDQDTHLRQSFDIERDTRISTEDWLDIKRQRVCLYEIWYRKWTRGFVLTLPDGATVEFDPKDPRHAEAIVYGGAQVRQATFRKVRLAWYCGPHFLYDIPSPYRHRNFPYVPFFGYREDLTGSPYGLVRTMLSPQDEINARKSKMLWSLNSRRVIADADAVVDHARTAEEVARADPYIILNAQRGPNSRFEVSSGGELATQQFQVMQEAKQEIAESSGIHKSMMGQQSGATSGIAINSLVEQGLNTLAEINDNYRFSRRLVGEMLFDLVRQTLAGPTPVTLGEGKSRKVVMLNQPVFDEASGQPVIFNDVARVKVKVALDDVPSTPTYRMQQLSLIAEVTKSLPPNLQGLLADFFIESTDVPKRFEYAERIRQALGVQNDEEKQAAMEAQAQAAEKQQQLAEKKFILDAAESAARIRKINADADLVRFQVSGIRDQGSEEVTGRSAPA
jgi:hypothetical protein